MTSEIIAMRLIERGDWWWIAVDTLRLWHRRIRERRELMALSGAELHDFGVNRTDAIIEASKPFWRE